MVTRAYRFVKSNKMVFLLGTGYAAFFLHFRRRIVFNEGKPWLQYMVDKADQGFRDHLKWQMHTNLFANEFMDDITANSLVDLVHKDHIKVVITDLFLLMYQNKAFEKDTQRLTRNIINDYLESDLCKK